MINGLIEVKFWIMSHLHLIIPSYLGCSGLISQSTIMIDRGYGKPMLGLALLNFFLGVLILLNK